MFDLNWEPYEYFPLPEAIAEIVNLDSELEYEGRNYDFNIADCEIKKNIYAYIKVGLLAYNIKRYKLYLVDGIKTFKEYCERYLQRTHWSVNKTIQAAKTTMKLIKMGFGQIPQNEAQAKPLTKIKDDEELKTAWENVIASAAPHRITAPQVDLVVNGEMKQTKNLKIDKQVYDKLHRKAISLGMSVEDFLSNILAEDDVSTEVEPEKVSSWEEDVEKLVAEETIEPILHISFGKTLPQLYNGKTLTIREWKDSYAQKFINAFTENKLVTAIDKDLRAGGKAIGTVRLTQLPYKARLGDITPQEIVEEGFLNMSPEEFIRQFFCNNPNKTVWVIGFEFTPNNREVGSS